jgi:hypothetical protein
MKFIWFSLAALLVSSPLFAQGTRAPDGADLPGSARPSAISGTPSSARYCVSGDEANVHGIGWVDTGASYAITFESDVPLVTAMSRLDLAGVASLSTFASGDFSRTTSTPGTMALHVGANGQAGCYRFKVEVTPPAGSTLSAAASHAPVVVKASKSAAPLAITGLASSAKFCVAGNFVANVHDIGRIEEGNQITISFESDFDPIAGVTLLNLSTQRGTFVIDDDGGGNLEPLINFTASHSSTLSLYVAGFEGVSGCYRYKVEIR